MEYWYGKNGCKKRSYNKRGIQGNHFRRIRIRRSPMGYKEEALEFLGITKWHELRE